MLCGNTLLWVLFPLVHFILFWRGPCFFGEWNKFFLSSIELDACNVWMLLCLFSVLLLFPVFKCFISFSVFLRTWEFTLWCGCFDILIIFLTKMLLLRTGAVALDCSLYIFMLQCICCTCFHTNWRRVFAFTTNHSAPNAIKLLI